MSIRATEQPPTPLEPKPRNTKVIAALVALGVVAAAALAVGTGVVHLPFIGSQTVTEEDPTFGWTITFPRAWNSKEVRPTGATTVRYQTAGKGVGLRVQVILLKGEMPVEGAKDKALQDRLSALVKQGRPDLTPKEGPIVGAVHGIPYVFYRYAYTDFSSGVAIKLEDSDYFFFNGVKLENVTFETTAIKYPAQLKEFEKVVQTFRSRKVNPDISPKPSTAGSVTGTP